MQGLKYNVDLVMCIDCTASMSGILNTVKENALKFHSDLLNALDEKGKEISQLRIRVLAFRDYYYDGDMAMETLDFVTLPDQEHVFSEFINNLEPMGGGDEPENGLEALSLAIKSNWGKDGDRRREIVIVWTDASAHSLEKNTGSKPSNYPSDIPENMDELYDLWDGQKTPMNASAKRLLIYAPDSYPWSDLSNDWESTMHFPSRAGTGLDEVSYEQILNAISNSV
ncbi:vWA domain-containing protein [Tenacibaculum amylolyticum]|uniref:vWA domain-containing protein n=1 Tax=Tenacibaculum amylolyticum TaxID=104269 RepID=UPI003895F570